MEPLIVLGTCIAIALLAACDIYLAVTLWRERGKELREIWLQIESPLICLLSWLSEKASRQDDCPGWADPERWNATK